MSENGELPQPAPEPEARGSDGTSFDLERFWAGALDNLRAVIEGDQESRSGDDGHDHLDPDM